MTSNLGAEILNNAISIDDGKKIRAQVMDIVKASFRPEFINRIDEITIFHKLDKWLLFHISRWWLTVSCRELYHLWLARHHRMLADY